MESGKISYMAYVGGFFLIAILALGGLFLFPSSRIAQAHEFSASESAQFLSLVEQIRAETRLVTTNLENNNATLASEHIQRAANILSNSTLDEIREVNNRIADTLESTLVQLRDNVTSLTISPQEQIPQDRMQSVNQTVQSLNDTLSEAVTVRVESEQRNNATTWAMVLANLTNAILRNYGNATGAPFDLTDMTNLAGMEGQNAHAAGEGINNNTMPSYTTASNVTTNTIIVDEAAYQAAQYLANNTLLQLFNDTLKPLTTSSTGANGTTINNIDNSSMILQQQIDNNSLSAGDNNTPTTGVEELERSLFELRDSLNSRVNPEEVMRIAHLKIHPMLTELYGLILKN